MKGKLIWSIFWMTIAVFVIIILGMFGLFRLSGEIGWRFIFFPAWAIFTGLGIALIILTIKQKVAGKLKVFILIAGASATGFLIFVVLHNLVSALLNTEEPVFFILAGVLCPAGFLIGVLGTIIQAIKNKPSGFQIKTS